MLFRLPWWLDRRDDPRFYAKLETSCVPVGNENLDKPWPARVHDISSTGLSLVLQRRFERGTLLTLDLENPAEKFRRTVIVKVVRIRRTRDGRWNLGCALDGQFDAEALEMFGVKAKKPPPKRERAWIRLPSRRWTTCYLPEENNGALRKVRVVNVCPGGIGLLVNKQIAAETLLGVQVPGGKGPQHRVLARVIHVTPQPHGQWLLGCAFLGEISDQELQAFLQ
jgi:hypothetical protein